MQWIWTKRLSAFVIIGLLLITIGCAQESTPYTDQTAEIDPAMNIPDDNNTGQPNNTHTDSGLDNRMPSSRSVTDASLQPGEKIELTPAQWRSILSEEEYDILRQSGTERPGTGRYNEHPKDEAGAFHCVGCGNKLYDAKHKFHSGCGWPSFNQAVEPGALTTHVDRSFGMVRTEMRCARCDGHLGHIFQDAPDQPTGTRHCVNGNVIIFVPEGADVKDVIRAHREQYANR